MTERSLSFSQRLAGLVRQIYPEVNADILTSQIVNAFWPEGTHRRKRARPPGNTLWSEQDAMLITYGNSIQDGTHKPLDLLHDFLLRHLRGVVNGVHILPFFPYTSDDGFAVTDYRAVNPQLGDWADIRRIAGDFHLMSDLVLNHVSSQGPWFNAYRQGQPPYDRFFFEASPDDDLSAVVRPRTTPLLQEVDTSAGPRHVWCTFSHDQVDLDFRNPEVLLEMLRIIRLHVDQGVRILRLDAVAFLWKEAGTGTKWGLVRLGNPAGGAAAIPVRLTASPGGGSYTGKEQVWNGSAWSDKPGVAEITCVNLSETTGGCTSGLDLAPEPVVLVTAISGTFFFERETNAKYKA
jgi:sucrose phosphorylase